MGKIFKPALRWDATRRVYEGVLKEIEALTRSIVVDVREDRVHGAVAHIHIEPAGNASNQEIEKRVGDLLSCFTIPYRLTIA